MKKIVVLFLFVCLSLPHPGVPQAAEAIGDSSCCGMVQEALADSKRVQPGMKRKDVERYFKFDGGLQFPGNTRYTYPRCEYIKLQVEFDLAPARGESLISPDDRVTKVSKLFIDYPVMD